MDNKAFILTTSDIRRSNLSRDLLTFLFYYKEGDLYWRVKPAITVDISKPAGSINGGGFREIRINKNRYRVDFLVWIYFTDTPPGRCVIKHKDENKLNTRFENLKLVED